MNIHIILSAFTSSRFYLLAFIKSSVFSLYCVRVLLILLGYYYYFYFNHKILNMQCKISQLTTKFPIVYFIFLCK